MHDSADLLDDGLPPDTPAPVAHLLATGAFHERAPYHVVRRRGTQDWLLTLTLDGRGRYRQAGVEFTAEPGDLVLLEPGAYQDYGCDADTPWVFLWAHFLPRRDWRAWMRLPRAHAQAQGLRKLALRDEVARRRAEAAFQRCHADARAAGHGASAELALNGLEEVLLIATHETELARRDRPPSTGVRRALEHLAEHLDHTHTVEALAKLANLSPSRFAHRFKEETGEPVIAYLLKLRLREAARLLAHTSSSVSEVSAACGFHSPFYFSRQFRRHFESSPRAFRQQQGRAE